jgi:hypothetical protein
MRNYNEYLEYLGIDPDYEKDNRKDLVKMRIPRELKALELNCEYCLSGDYGLYLFGEFVCEFMGCVYFKSVKR